MGEARKFHMEELLGQVFRKVMGCEPGSSTMVLIGDEYRYAFSHFRDCCEVVEIIDVIGEPEDLVGSPMLMAEEATNVPEEETPGPSRDWGYDELHQWTFYKFATIKGYVTVRWLGESNGYYGVEVDRYARRVDDKGYFSEYDLGDAIPVDTKPSGYLL